MCQTACTHQSVTASQPANRPAAREADVNERTGGDSDTHARTRLITEPAEHTFAFTRVREKSISSLRPVAVWNLELITSSQAHRKSGACIYCNQKFMYFV